MYWPVGSPRAYSLSKQATLGANVGYSSDGLPGRETLGERSTNRTVGSIAVLGSGQSESEREEEEHGSVATPAEDSPADGESHDGEDGEILASTPSRRGDVFATITRSTLTVWQTKPTVALAAIVRSPRSMKSYGPNTALLLRPDTLIIVVQTTLGYLITYTLATDSNARVYCTQLPNSSRHARKDSTDGYSSYRRQSTTLTGSGSGEAEGVQELNLRFRMVIRIDAGISKTIALDDDLVVATRKPAALQYIHWASDNARPPTITELLGRVPWLATSTTIVYMVYDRPMNINCWVTSDGKAYVVQRSPPNVDAGDSQGPFQGFCFREPESEHAAAVKVAINARFSLIAVGCANEQVDVFVVKDYTGNVPLSHRLRLPVSKTSAGKLTVLTYSPDGYCLFAGYEKGWATWSVYGKPGPHSFGADRALSLANDERWLLGVRSGFWIGGGCELALVGMNDDRLWIVDFSRSAFIGCFSSANIAQGLLQSSNSIMLYRGHDVPDLTALPTNLSLWQTVQMPAAYLTNQWPVKSAVASPDRKYIAIAGRRGLAHYSVASGRWKTFDDSGAENEFTVRGGMCWHQHFLIASVETGDRYQVRVYSREKALDYSRVLHTEELAAPTILTIVSGTDSLLVYTYDNVLHHYIIVTNPSTAKLVKVGQIGFHGIVRAPPRVRAISWILPEDQLEHGDPSQDVATASVLFLVDGKLVLLQPSTNEHGELKYNMRVIAQNVEYYILLRDQPSAVTSLTVEGSHGRPNGFQMHGHLGHSLRDSLWYFDGDSLHVWSDIQDVLACAPAELGRDLPSTVRVPMDFYPVAAMVGKGIVHGLDADLVQRRDVKFSFFRQAARTQLFLPHFMRYHLAEYNSPAALHLAGSYQHLPYFAHALEVLLHDVLDSEVDHPPSPQETALLPTVTSFLSSFPSNLDIVVNCTRKTELRSWRTLFSHLPPVLELFEQSLAQGSLKTAAGYLLVLHTFEQEAFQVHEFARLLRCASAKQDWELCKDLARFLVGIDATGQTLHAALADAGLQDATDPMTDGQSVNGIHLHPPGVGSGENAESKDELRRDRLPTSSGLPTEGGMDYFSRGHSG